MAKADVIALLQSGRIKEGIELYNKEAAAAKEANITYNSKASIYVNTVNESLAKLREGIDRSPYPELKEIKDKLIFPENLTVENLKDNIESFRAATQNNTRLFTELITKAIEESYN